MRTDLVLRLRALFRRPVVDREIDEELRFHLDRQAESYEHSGLDRSEAVRRARLEFGGLDQAKEEYRDALGVNALDNLWRDVLLALRSLRTAPVIGTIAILSLALGIGANTAIFSLINGLMLRTLPVRQPEQLALVSGAASNNVQVWSHPVWEHIRERPQLFGGAFAWSTPRLNLAHRGEAEFVDGLFASGGFFDVLGVTALLGRTFTDADDRRGGGSEGTVAMISYRFWQGRFGGVPDVIGRPLVIEGVPFTIVGVTPPTFVGADVGRAFDVALPLNAEPLLRGRETLLDQWNSRWLSIMVRLQPGQSLDQATMLLRSLQPEIREAAAPTAARGYLAESFTLVPAMTGRSGLRTRYGRPLLTLLGIAALILLIACANVANLLLAQAAARRHEFKIRLALGASRWQLARPLLAQSMVLSAAGAIVGLFFARWSGPLLIRQLSTQTTTVFLDVPLDWRVLMFAVAVAFATAMLFGIAPAVRVSRAVPADDLNEQARGGSGGSSQRGVAGSLVIAQVALSLILLVAAGLFIRTLIGLVTLDPGFDTNGLLVINVNAARTSVEPDQRLAMYERALDAVRGVPGVSAAALSMLTPVGGASSNAMMEVVGKTSESRETYIHSISPGWFATYGTPLLAGRDFTDADRGTSPKVAIVNQAFARKYVGADNPIGRVIRETSQSTTPTPSLEIVGLASDAIYVSLREEVPPTAYVPITQEQGARVSAPSVNLSVRASNGATPFLVRPIMAAITDVNPDLSLSVRALSDSINATLTQERVTALLSGFFGGLAVLLAALGLYGITSYAVASRRAEIGIRLAVGAVPNRIVRLLMNHVLSKVAVGIVLGTMVSFWASRFVSPLVWGLDVRDSTTLASAATILTVVGALATFLPARRAAQIDPAVVLREH